MLWKTHIRISFEVLNRLGISLSPEETENFFVRYILQPVPPAKLVRATEGFVNYTLAGMLLWLWTMANLFLQ
jgi:hypothetical protein